MKSLIALILTFYCFSLNAQVGVNTDNPEQTLDNGKLKIGDDANMATEGNIRYNSTLKNYEVIKAYRRYNLMEL